jgi:hypothetical protein
MPSSAIHRFAIFLASCTLCLVAATAFVQSARFPELDRVVGPLVTALSLLQAAWISSTNGFTAVKILAWFVPVLAAANVWLAPLVARAGLAQLLFALTVALAVVTSPTWARGPRPVEDEGIPSMRTLGWLTPLCVLLQVLLGAAIRYDLLPVWTHITGSFVAGALLMFAGMAALQSYGGHDALKRVSTVLLWVTGLQLTLGMAAYGVRVAKDAEAWTVYLTIAHVVAGAVTLGSATAFALQVFYHVRETLLVREAAA